MKTNKVIFVGVLILVVLSIVAILIPVGYQVHKKISSDTMDIVNKSGMYYSERLSKNLTVKFEAVNNLSGLIETALSKFGDDVSVDYLEAIVTAVFYKNDASEENYGFWVDLETSLVPDALVSDLNGRGNDTNKQLSFYVHKKNDSVVKEINFRDDSVENYYEKSFQNGKPFVTDPYLYDGINMVSITIPIENGDKVVGVAGIDIKTDLLENMIKNVVVFDHGGARLFTNNYQVLSNSKGLRESGKKLKNDQETRNSLAKVYAGQVVRRFFTLADNEEYFAVNYPIAISDSGINWALGISIPVSAINDDVWQTLYAVYWTAVIVLLIAIIVAVLFSIYVTRMIAAKDHWYEQVLQTISSPLLITDMNMKLDFLNDSGIKALGVKDKDYLKNYCGGICKLPICDPSAERCPLRRLQKNGTKVVSEPIYDDFWEIHSDYIYDRKGKKVGMIEFLLKITARKRVEKIIERVSALIDRVSDSSNQINAAAQNLSQGATEQAASLEQITSSTSDAAAKTSKNSGNATEANQIAKTASNLAGAGSGKMEELEKSMEIITGNSELTRSVVKTIDDIAFQTNLLALNAAVEAARAGSHGKGFAVVAEEVRNLAARSAKAAQETANLIDKSNDEIIRGAELSKETAEALGKIAEETARVEAIISEIAAASVEQSEGIMQINLGLEQIDKVTQQNTATAEQTASSSAELKQQIKELMEILADGSQNENKSKAVKKKLRKKSLPKKVQPQVKKAEVSSDDEWGGSVVEPSQQIKLDDSEFGKF